MKTRMFLAAAVAAIALSAFGLSADFIEWGRGPAHFLMTAEEAAQWKTISSDDEAKRFISLFWARRDPTPDTPMNEYRLEYEKRVATADKNFASETQRGALSDRGRALIIFGMPKKIERSGAQRDQALPQGITMPTPAGSGDTAGGFSTASTDPLAQRADDKTEAQVWTYEGDSARELFGLGRAVLRFVDRTGKGGLTLQQGSGVDVPRAEQRVIAKAIVNPGLTEAPMFAAAAASSIPEPAAPVVQTELTTETLKTAVNELKAAGKSPYAAQSYASFGEFVTGNGDYFVPVQVYVPKTANLASTNLTFFGVVQDASGNNVIAFEEPATVTASKEDFFVERTFTGLPAGKLRGYFGLAANGTPVTMTVADMELAGLDPAAPSASPLILSNNVYPLSAAQLPTDPFAFGGLKVVPKGDRTFRPSDELWYFVELRNPGLAEPAAAAAAAVPVTGDAPAAPAAMPKIQIKVDVEGTDASGKKHKMTSPPREVDAIEIKGVPGHYGVGSAIPLSSFKPGDYTMNVKVIDTVKKSSYTYSEKFRVVE
jgi:GWxTD domain-containing protein